MAGANTCYYVEYNTSVGGGMIWDAPVSTRSLPLAVSNFADAPANLWADLGSVEEVATIALPPRKDLRTEQSIKVGLKLFQIALGAESGGRIK